MKTLLLFGFLAKLASTMREAFDMGKGRRLGLFIQTSGPLEH